MKQDDFLIDWIFEADERRRKDRRNLEAFISQRDMLERRVRLVSDQRVLCPARNLCKHSLDTPSGSCQLGFKNPPLIPVFRMKQVLTIAWFSALGHEAVYGTCVYAGTVIRANDEPETSLLRCRWVEWTTTHHLRCKDITSN